MQSDLLALVCLMLIIFLCIVVLYIKNGKSIIWHAALYLVTLAEETFGSKTGQIKFASVMTEIKKTFPVLTLFIRPKVIKEIIENALEVMKEIFKEKYNDECCPDDNYDSEDKDLD